MSRITHAEAPTKVILSGEHSVVYGFPALVMALDLKVGANVETIDKPTILVSSPSLGSYELDLKSFVGRGDESLLPATEVAHRVMQKTGYTGGLGIKTWSQAPIAAGIGSSASSFVSIASSCFKSLGYDPTKAELFEAAMVGERLVHQNPSGVDVEIAISGGIIRYVKSKGSFPSSISGEIPLVVINTGETRRTGEMVTRFGTELERRGEAGKLWLEHIGLLTSQIERALEKDDLELAGALMTSNHLVLSFFGVSTPRLDEIVRRSVISGAFGAKLTGAGGGGSAIALATATASEEINKEMNQIGYQSFKARVSGSGVKCWQE
jgi:mevalonate kinase